MDCMESRFKMQALIDNELNENEISEVMAHVESCYNCRQEYIDFLKLQKRLAGVSSEEPSREWFEELEGSRFRRGVRKLGYFIFLGSYLFLLTYFLFRFFTDGSEDFVVRLLVGGVVSGGIILFLITLADRIREGKTDKYKGVIK